MKRLIVVPMLVLMLFTNLTLVESKSSAADEARKSLENYFKAWKETDMKKREALLDPSWAEDGTYTDPTVAIVGRKGLIDHIEGFVSSEQSRNFSIVQDSDIDFHHNSFRFAWKMVDKSGRTITPGIDYGEFNDDGQITKIVGFFGPMPKLKQ